MKELLRSLAANKVVEIDTISHKLVKLAAILISDRTRNHSSVMYFHSSRYLISQALHLDAWQVSEYVSA